MKITKPNIDPKKALGSLDNLANKIPDDIAKLIKKVAIAIFIFFIILAAYYGWTIGYGDNTTEGMKLAEDQKSLFKVDIEREYNRKRKDINLSDIEIDIYQKAEERMLREDYLRKNYSQNKDYLIHPSENYLEEDTSLFRQKDLSPFPEPISIQDPKEILPGKDNSTSPVIQRMDTLEDEINKSEERTKQLEKAIERLESIYEKRELIKPR